MENMMKYPYIGKIKGGTPTLFASPMDAVLLGTSGSYTDGWNEINFKNITREYLQNTYGKVVSHEHEEFIVELAKSAGFSVFTTASSVNYFVIKVGLSFHSCEEITSTELKQITIPLPPKAEPKIYLQENIGELPKHFDCVCSKCGGKCCTGRCDKQESSEWPQIGSIVTWGNKSVKGEVKALSDGLAWIKNEYGNYCSEYVSSLQKPKTPEEELRDEIADLAFNQFNDDSFDLTHNSHYLASDLMSKYNITKKPQ